MAQLNDIFVKLDKLSLRMNIETHNYENFLEFIALYEEGSEILTSIEQEILSQRQKLETYWGEKDSE